MSLDISNWRKVTFWGLKSAPKWCDARKGRIRAKMGEVERISEFSFCPKRPILGQKGVRNKMLGRLVQVSEKESKRAKKGENRGGF